MSIKDLVVWILALCLVIFILLSSQHYNLHKEMMQNQEQIIQMLEGENVCE